MEFATVNLKKGIVLSQRKSGYARVANECYETPEWVTERARITNASRAADLMRKGAILAKMHIRTGLCWFLVPGGEVSEAIAAELLKRPDVQPNDDGLFPGIPQTFKLGSR